MAPRTFFLAAFLTASAVATPTPNDALNTPTKLQEKREKEPNWAHGNCGMHI